VSKLILTNAYVAVEGIDVSGYTSAVAIEITSEEIDTTQLGSPYRTSMDGERTISVALDVFSGNDTLRGTMQTAYSAGTDVDVEFRPRNASQSSTNPSVVVACQVLGFAPFGGAVGEAARPMVKLAATGAETIDDEAAAAFYGEAIYGEAAFGG